MTRIFRHYHRLGRIEEEVNPNNLEGKSSEDSHTLFEVSNLPELCSYINCPVKSCKPNCRIENFYNKYGTEYLRL